MSSEDYEKILDSIPWRCFHCDFITTDYKTALAHFGDRDDAEEFKPLCKWWSRMSDEEKRQELQDALVALHCEQMESESLRIKVEGLEYIANSHVGAIKSFKPFRECNSVYDVFCVYDSLEGRCLAAEEAIRARTDSGSTITTPDSSQDSRGQEAQQSES